jgi:ADP-dependent NAD(P)H-hydrate dehydratase
MSEHAVVTNKLLRDWLPPRVDDDDDKFARGSVVVVGGAADTPGAVLLAGVAALRVGAGRLTIATAECNAAALAVAVPESAVTALRVDPDGAFASDQLDLLRDLVAGADAVLIGPGMRGPDRTRELVSGLLDAIGDETTVVLDAMGLTCGALNDSTATRFGGRLIATPNVKEAGYLLDSGQPRPDPDTAARLAQKLRAVVALHSHTAAPDGRVWVDGSGNSGLGTSGSGDVLAGTVVGLAARGAGPEQAAVWGVHLHAEAGERLAAQVGRVGYLARELLDEIPRVLDELDG